MKYLLLLIVSASLFAGEIGGVNLPNSMTVGEANLMLNGAGLRKKLFIKVYAGGLYLAEKQANENTVINADQPMAIRMHFIYDGVSAEKLIGAWNEGFGNATKGNTASIQAEIDQFNSYFTAEAKKNDIYDVIYEPGVGVTLKINGTAKGTIPGLAFKKAVFGIWLCDKPADAGLKAGMLGK